MSKSFTMRIKQTGAMQRSANAVSAMMRRPVIMKHRSTERGGQVNSQADALDQLEEEYGDWE